MNKVIVGIGLLICGILSEFITYLYALPLLNRIVSNGLGSYALPHPMLSDFAIAFVIAGVILCIWGLTDRDKNELKKTVFGTGMIICGVLRLYFIDILHGVVYIVPVRFRPLGPPEGPAYILIIAGIAFSIWGLIKKGKKKRNLPEGL